MEEILEVREVVSSSWRPDDAVVHAASIGAEPATDLEYVDLSRGPLVMPTFAAARIMRMWQGINWIEPWGFDPRDTFLLGCDIAIHSEIPAAAVVESTGGNVELWDKGSSAVVVSETGLAADGVDLCTFRTVLMVRGRGGFGGERGPSRTPPPEIDAATELAVHLPANSAVLYQLVGEHNPHSLDADFATQAGLPGPISAGQVLIGAVARTLTAEFADGDHQALSRVSVDYAGSHVTGQPLTMRVQQDGTNSFDFAVHSGDQPILLGGRAELT